jgi:diguanylate cyclase (GGDEF)-like protein/PAS domain S-box-containing protein
MHLSTEDRLQAILDGTGAGTWEWNLDSGSLEVNAQWVDMLGYTHAELAPLTIHTWERLTHPQDREAALAEVDDLLLGGSRERYDRVIRMRHKDGSWRFIHARGMLLTDSEEGGERWLIGTHLDVTDQKRTEHQLAQIAESLPGIIYSFVMRPDGSYFFSYVSRKTEDFYGFTPGEVDRNPDRIFDIIHPDDLDAVKASIAASYASLEQWTSDYRVQVNGKITWMRGIAQPEREPDGVVTWHGMVINIDDQKFLEAELKKLSVTDELTGVYNRRYMLERLEGYAAEHGRYGGTFSLISIDIDYFKSVNDTYGHLVGDQVLRDFAALISQRVRKTDVLARTGGEEFLILMPQSSLENATRLAEDVRVALEQHSFQAPDGTDFQLTISAGIVNRPGDAVSVEDLLSVCDESLYRAKREGRNRIVVDHG